MSAPSLDVDLWSDEALLDPRPLWRTLRDAGPVVHLAGYDLWALPRYAETRDALSDWQTFTSSEGVTLNDTMNAALEGITLHTDPPEHDVLSRIIRRPITPKALREMEARFQSEADAIVARLVEQRTFDANRDLATHLPLSIVSEELGLPEDGRERMLDWGFATFQCFGPDNARTREYLPVLEEAVAYSFDATLPSRLKPDGWAARLWQAADAGEIPHAKCPIMLNDYWGPSLDTTIYALTSAIWLFAEHPDQWDIVRADPEGALTGAINEVLRYESPLSQFSRVATRERTYGSSTIPEGARVLMMYGSANRDERKWEEPERFDVTRRAADHLGFGRGEHSCAGQPLARLEMRTVLLALARTVARFELRGLERAMNNTLRGIARLEIEVLPA